MTAIPFSVNRQDNNMKWEKVEGPHAAEVCRMFGLRVIGLHFDEGFVYQSCLIDEKLRETIRNGANVTIEFSIGDYFYQILSGYNKDSQVHVYGSVAKQTKQLKETEQ